MTVATQILIACLAFAGATVAQIMSHWLTLVRSRAEQQQETLLFFQALKSDVDYTCLQLCGALSLFDDIMQEKEEYSFTSDKLYLQLNPLVIEKYEPRLLVHPGLVHRARFFYSQVREIFEGIRGEPEAKITAAGKKYIVAYLRYGLSLALRFEKLARQGGAIEEYESASDEMLLDYLFKTRFVGGGTILSRSDLAKLFSETSKDVPRI